MSVVLGPILQFRGCRNNQWRLSALLVIKDGSVLPPIKLGAGGKIGSPKLIARVPFSAPSHRVYRVEFELALGATAVLEVDGLPYRISAPDQVQAPRLAYVSCNGFSDPKLAKNIAHKNERWLDLARTHASNHYHLLLMGGDQIYSDAMWQTVPALKSWTEKPSSARIAAKFTAEMNNAVDRFYCNTYLERWAQPEVAAVLGAIPTIMMWDDHDILDGWGSYPQPWHDSPVYQGIFGIARKYFRVFQLQLADDETHPAALAGQDRFNLGFANLGNLSLLVLDTRSERQPQPSQVLSSASWEAVFNWLNTQKEGPQHLLLMSSIPVAYLDLTLLEKLLGALPGQQELEDDLRDHWRSTPNQQERLRLIHRLLAFSQDSGCRVTILSGDVHVGAMAVIESQLHRHGSQPVTLNQLVSSGVVHPAPPALARYVLESMADKVETVEHGVSAAMQALGRRGSYLIGARNWLALEPDELGRIWANWHVENEPSLTTKVLQPMSATPVVA